MEEVIEKYRYKDLEAYKLALAMPPPKGLQSSRSIGGGKKSEYESIEVQEAFADNFFREWQVVDEKYMNVLNEIVCTVKIQALPDYPGSDYISFSGSASSAIQTDKGSKAEEFPKGKKLNALEYCLPKARSGAIGCALETLGNIFGRNMNRKVSNDFSFGVAYKEEKEAEEKEGKSA